MYIASGQNEAQVGALLSAYVSDASAAWQALKVLLAANKRLNTA
ncbi:MAG: hypothetical protein ACRENP_12525 [Longimicrobiales bacterium]